MSPFAFIYRKLVVKLPQYNQIRQLKRQLQRKDEELRQLYKRLKISETKKSKKITSSSAQHGKQSTKKPARPDRCARREHVKKLLKKVRFSITEDEHVNYSMEMDTEKQTTTSTTEGENQKSTQKKRYSFYKQGETK